MNSGAVGHDYHAALNKHASQKDYASGFGGKYGVQDRQDKVSLCSQLNDERLRA